MDAVLAVVVVVLPFGRPLVGALAGAEAVAVVEVEVDVDVSVFLLGASSVTDFVVVFRVRARVNRLGGDSGGGGAAATRAMIRELNNLYYTILKETKKVRHRSRGVSITLEAK